MSKPTNVLQLSTMGRPLQLGMLYDIRTDLLVPGVTLWDRKVLQANVEVKSQPSTNFHLLTSDSTNDKMSSLNVEASLKMSFLSGLVDVKGSAKYLNDRKTSSRQSRVTLQYSCITKFEQLTMEHLGQDNLKKHGQIFEDNTATHVVVGVVYGADAFLIFDKTVESSEELQEIQGSLEVSIKKIPMFSIEGKGRVAMSDEERKATESIQCKFYGDFILDENPSNYEQAIEVYQKLPNLLGPNKENVVPKMVWLYPLASLDTKVNQILRQISSSLVDDSVQILEDIHQSKILANEFSLSKSYSLFPWIKEDADRFLQYVSTYEQTFRRDLMKVLPQIRGGGVEEQALAQLLADHHSSLFSRTALTSWINKRRKEIKILDAHVKELQRLNVKLCFKEGDLDELFYENRRPKLIAFEFCLLGTKDPVIEDMKKTVNRQHLSETEDQLCWFNDSDCLAKMTKNIRSFRTFAEQNRNWPSTKFVASLEQWRTDSKVASNIAIYTGQGKANFCPPSPPGTPSISSVNHDCLVITWAPPKSGDESITGYECWCSLGKDSGKVWKMTTTGKELCAKISVSQRGCYEAKVRGVTLAGVSEFSLLSESNEFCGTWFPMDSQMVRIHLGLDRTLVSVTAMEGRYRTISEFFNTVCFEKTKEKWMVPNALNTASSAEISFSDFLFMLGKTSNDDGIRSLRETLHLPIAEDEKTNHLKILFKNGEEEQEFLPEEMLTFFLWKLCWERAARYLDYYCLDAKISVPVNFNDLQRVLVERAATNAGFRRVELVDETSDNSAQSELLKNIASSGPYFHRLRDERTNKISELKHDNVLLYVAEFLHSSNSVTAKPFLIMEYANGILLEKSLQDNPGKVFEMEQVSRFSKQILSGLVYLHSKNLIHADLRPANILIFNELDLKIMKAGDLDDLCSTDDNTITTKNYIEESTVIRYFSPEMAHKYMIEHSYDVTGTGVGSVGPKTDIWSFGCIIMEMMRGNSIPKFRKTSDGTELVLNEVVTGKDIVKFIQAGGVQVIDFEIGSDMKEMVSKCHQVNPDSRPTSKELLSSFGSN